MNSTVLIDVNSIAKMIYQDLTALKPVQQHVPKLKVYLRPSTSSFIYHESTSKSQGTKSSFDRDEFSRNVDLSSSVYYNIEQMRLFADVLTLMNTNRS